jgi:hypothetical protein
MVSAVCTVSAGKLVPGPKSGFVRHVARSFGLFPIRSVLRNISESRMTTEGITATIARIGPQRLLVVIMRYPKARTIHLLPDNLNIHHRKSLTDLLGEDFVGEVRSRFTVYYAPAHGSWLNHAEIGIGILSRQCPGRRRIPDLKNLRREVRAWNRHINLLKTRINRTFTRQAARRTFGYKRPFTRSQHQL